MKDSAARHNPIGLLAEHLTELGNRLRRALPDPSGSLSPPRCLSRLRISSRLLKHLALQHECHEAWKPLAESLEALCDATQSHPERLPRDLVGPLAALTEKLDGVFVEIDVGTPIEPILADDEWAALLRKFRNAGTEEQVLDDLEELLEKQEESGDRTVLQAGDRRLALRWAELRRRGDRLFHRPLVLRQETQPGLPLVNGQEPVCALLLASPFQRDMILPRLRGASVRVLENVEQVIELVRENTSPVVLLIDNLEPSCHLDRVLELLEAENAHRPAWCILIGGTLPRGNDSDRRAIGRGADGVWSSPYDPGRLRDLLTPASSTEVF